MVAATCEMCLRDYVIQDDIQPQDLCDECATWLDYWNSLTPEEKRAEERAMALYTSESEGL